MRKVRVAVRALITETFGVGVGVGVRKIRCSEDSQAVPCRPSGKDRLMGSGQLAVRSTTDKKFT
jgi:hypothetical protein